MDNGRITLLVTADGTVAQDTIVTVGNPSGLPNDPGFVSNTGVNFGAATLLKPVTLTLSYVPGNIPSGSTESQLKLVKLVGGSWNLVDGSTVDTTGNSVSADISSFGTYGIKAVSAG